MLLAGIKNVIINDDDDDDEEWGVNMSAGCCLQKVSMLLRNDVIEPVIAFASFSNFGSYKGPGNHQEVSEAVGILHRDHPDLIVDGEI